MAESPDLLDKGPSSVLGAWEAAQCVHYRPANRCRSGQCRITWREVSSSAETGFAQGWAWPQGLGDCHRGHGTFGVSLKVELGCHVEK